MARRALAASVVVTVSLVQPACTDAKETTTRNPPFTPEGADAKGREPDPKPGSEGKAPVAETPEGKSDDGAAASSGGTEPAAETTGGDGSVVAVVPKPTIERRPDGTCVEIVEEHCDPGDRCNPPPPREVPCPLPKAKNPDRVRMRDNGECYESFSTNCPPGARCNPPPPRQVECPPDVKKR
ncbi:MAG: hypothetical protein AAF721_25305 [Myxococcota bacterium]